MQMQKESSAMASLTLPELLQACNPLWCSLSMETKSRYMMEVREAMGGGMVKGGYDSYGRP